MDVKENFRNKDKDPWCISCGLARETQSHFLECPEILKKLGYLADKNTKYEENFIYGSLEEQEIIINILKIRDELKTKIIDESNPSVEGPFAHAPIMGH